MTTVWVVFPASWRSESHMQLSGVRGIRRRGTTGVGVALVGVPGDEICMGTPIDVKFVFPLPNLVALAKQQDLVTMTGSPAGKKSRKHYTSLLGVWDAPDLMDC